jgi:hypothetical protein
MTMLAATGAFFMSWSMLELGLDFCATMVFHHFGGNECGGAAPRSLKRKIALIRKCLQRSEDLTPYRSQFAALLGRVGNITEFRHQITHGVSSSMGGDDTFTFVRLIHDDQGLHTASVQTFTLAVIRANEREAAAIAHGVLGVGFMLAKSVAPAGFYDEIEKQFSGI